MNYFNTIRASMIYIYNLINKNTNLNQVWTFNKIQLSEVNMFIKSVKCISMLFTVKNLFCYFYAMEKMMEDELNSDIVWLSLLCKKEQFTKNMRNNWFFLFPGCHWYKFILNHEAKPSLFPHITSIRNSNKFSRIGSKYIYFSK